MPGQFAKAAVEGLIAKRTVRHVSPTASAGVTLDATDQVIRVTTPASSVGIITMSPTPMCGGKFYSFYVDSDGGGEVQIVSANAVDLVGDNLGAAADKVLLYCDGMSWFLLFDTTS